MFLSHLLDFLWVQGLEVVDNEFFITEDNRKMLKLAKEANSIVVWRWKTTMSSNIVFSFFSLVNTLGSNGLHLLINLNKNLLGWQFDYRIPLIGRDSCGFEEGTGGMSAIEQALQMNGLPISVYAPETVGCVAVDVLGRCAAATSTGGLMNKMNGRIGDSPLIGAGTYASDLCAVSATGEGEAIIRATLARDVSALMEYKGMGVKEAVECAIRERLEEGKGGLIAVSSNGDVTFGFNCVGMFRGCANEDGIFEVGVW